VKAIKFFLILSASILGLTLFAGSINDSLAQPSRPFAGSFSRFPRKADGDRAAFQLEVPANDYQSDISRLIALRSQPLDDLIALANQLESKWRQIDWNQYARIMIHICTEILNRRVNDAQLREKTEHFALVALSHSKMFLWEYQSDLVGALGYQRSSASDTSWPRERREKAELWLQTWQRLEKQADPNFDANDRKNLPSMKVYPPPETGLPAGTPASAIKDPRLRARHEAAIADNNRKAKRVEQQLPLHLHGPSFRARAERWLIQAYSQAPARNAELRRYLEVYVRDYKTRQRILRQVEKNSN